MLLWHDRGIILYRYRYMHTHVYELATSRGYIYTHFWKVSLHCTCTWHHIARIDMSPSVSG